MDALGLKMSSRKAERDEKDDMNDWSRLSKLEVAGKNRANSTSTPWYATTRAIERVLSLTQPQLLTRLGYHSSRHVSY